MEMKRMSDFERTGKLQRKIDISVQNSRGEYIYLHSTNWWRTQKDAIDAAKRKFGAHHKYKACWGD